MAQKKYKFASPLRYPGGKTRLASFIAGAISESFGGSKKVALVEPYAGGAGASLTLLLAGDVDEIVINDLDKAVHAFWKVAVNDTDYLVDRIRTTDITVEEWQKQKRIYEKKSTVECKQLAFATLFLNRTNRSGIMNGGPLGRLNQSGRWKIDARFTKPTIIGRLEKIKQYRRKITVSSRDGIDLLRSIEGSANSENYFIFLDPPYYQKGKSLYLNHYGDEDHHKLARFLEASSLKWIMTYDDVPFIQKLYPNSKTSQFPVQHSAFKSKVMNELMIFADGVPQATVA